MTMGDKAFLWWIHERLVHVHGEQELVDYMHRLRAIIADTPTSKATPNIARLDSDASELRKLFDA